MKKLLRVLGFFLLSGAMGGIMAVTLELTHPGWARQAAEGLREHSDKSITPNISDTQSPQAKLDGSITPQQVRSFRMITPSLSMN